MQKQLLGAFVFAVAVAIGAKLSLSSWGGAIYIASDRMTDHERNPAAIRPMFDYSRLEGQPLKIRSLKRLVNDARVVAGQGKVGIEFGHFVTKGKNGRGQFACDYYTNIEMKFEGEGVMEGGEKPIMYVQSPCVMSNDINRMEAIWIPYEKLMTEHKTPSRALEQDFPESRLHLKFEHMTSQWPRQWNLISVRLFHQTQPDQEVAISQNEIGEILDQPFLISF